MTELLYGSYSGTDAFGKERQNMNFGTDNTKGKLNRAAHRSLLSFAAVLTAFLLCGCGIFSLNSPSDKNTDTDDTTSPDTATETYEIYNGDYANEMISFMNDLSGKDWNGGACKIVTSADDLISYDDNSSLVISKEYEERNTAVEETLHISILCEKHASDTMLADIKAANRAGEYFADLIMLPQSQMGAYIADGAVANLRTLPGFNYEAGYYYPSSLGAGGGGNAIFAAAGPASLDPDCLSAVYFNTELCEKAGLESPYDLVDRGEWTVDKYLEYCAAVSSLDGDYASWGAQNTSPYITDLFYFGCGEKLTNVSLGYYPSIAVGGESALAAMTKVTACVNADGSVPALESINTFASGGSLFLIDSLSAMKAIVNSPCQWGILPMPKYDTQQEDYYSLAYYSDAMFFCVPLTAPDYTLAGDLLAALNIYSYGYVRDAYTTDASYYYLRDNQSIRMMSIIMENPVYDMAYTFADIYDAVPNATFAAIRNNAGGISTVERYINMWGTRFDNAMYQLFDVD